MDNKKTVRLEELLPVINEKLMSGGTVVLPITGTSMLPLLVAGRDKVTLKAAEFPLKKNDIPLFRRGDGTFVLHRVIGSDENGCIVCGDNQWVREYGVRDESVIGVVSFIERKGKLFSVSSRRYKIYQSIWRFLFPVRKYIVKLRGKLKK